MAYPSWAKKLTEVEKLTDDDAQVLFEFYQEGPSVAASQDALRRLTRLGYLESVSNFPWWGPSYSGLRLTRKGRRYMEGKR